MNVGSVFMGLLQGMTEFLPVSSSGHLGIAKIIMDLDDMPLSFDLVLHIATLLAVLVYFAKDIALLLVEWSYGFVNSNARSWAGWRFGWAVILASAITAPIGYALKTFEQTAASNPLWLGCNFWITGILLLSARFFRARRDSVRITDGIAVGLMQGAAVMPGISRSGSTIWAGLLCGLTKEEAFRFSFLLSMPAIVGATALESRHLGGWDAFISDLPSGWFLSAVVAFFSGLVSLIVLKRLVTSNRWWIFAAYCILLGTSCVVFSIMRA